ncbi:phosphate ABC transporter permease PstC [Mycoavidus sp. B2-EB]|uniref:phosphate ABC transporter permease PstC n=1 Tax=Mycoavidus sp. B2-EB TaxID=2651972 RepID=UPI001627B63F|nr:phosphate transport system permease protein [Mycoavidus sp. B2-EB]
MNRSGEVVLPKPRLVRRKALSRLSRLGDKGFAILTRGAALVSLLIFVGIILSLVVAAWPAMQKFGLGFLWQSRWDPPSDVFGALAPIYGTLVTSSIALLIAVPVSFGIAFFLTELAPAWLRQPLGMAIELLAAIPSIVYGMWGLLVFSPIFADFFEKPIGALLGPLPGLGALFRGPPIGTGLLCAGVILAMMIVPYIAAVMREVFELTPVLLKESAYGMGCTRWEVMRHIVLPYTKTGVVSGIMLGLGRALGETMAVTFVIGNTNLLRDVSLFSAGNSITSALANEFAEADAGLHSAALMELGLILFLITFVVLALSKWMLLRLEQKEGGR